jgi:hypothetical protein
MARTKVSTVPAEVPSVPTDNIERKCWNCKRIGLVAEKPVYSGNTGPGSSWFFKCPSCGARLQWILGPAMDGSASQKHKYKGAFMMNSMMSDPDCTVFSKEQQLEFNKPTYAKPGDVLFVYDEDNNKTHRWHHGRGEWVPIGRGRTR